MILLALLLAGAGGEPPLLAVLEFRNDVPGIDRDTDRNGNYLADVARTAIAARSLRVMTRENLVVLLASSGKVVADCIDKCEIETGRLVGADFVLSGTIFRFGEELRLSLLLHDTHSGTLLAGDTLGGPTVQSLEAALPQSVSKLLTRVPGVQQQDEAARRPFQGVAFALLGGGEAVFAVGGQVPGHEQRGGEADAVGRVGMGFGRLISLYLEGSLGAIRFSCCDGASFHRAIGIGAQSRFATLGRFDLSASLSLVRTINDAPGKGFAGGGPERRWELSPGLGIELPISAHVALAAETASPLALYPFGLGSLGVRAGLSYR